MAISIRVSLSIVINEMIGRKPMEDHSMSRRIGKSTALILSVGARHRCRSSAMGCISLLCWPPLIGAIWIAVAQHHLYAGGTVA
jgi:hypothetical protein